MNERGFTLVDLTISTVIVAIVVGLSYTGFMVADDAIDVSGARDRVERAADFTMKRLVSELRTGRLMAQSAAGQPPSITLSQPAAGLTLDDLDSHQTVQWEATPTIIRFRETEILREAEEDTDLNRDGDRKDRFAVGLLEIVVDGVAEPITTRGRVILGLPSYAGDLDGDGVADPLFSLDGGVLTVDLCLVTRTVSGQLLLSRTRGLVKLRNPQE